MSKRQFDETGYPCDAKALEWGSGEAWFYTQKEGILVCTDGCKHCGHQRNTLVLPWRDVKRALDDHEKSKGRKAVVGTGSKT